MITSTTANKGKYVGIRVRTRYGSAANGDRTYIYNNVIYNANHGISWNARNPGTQFICNNIVLNSKTGFPGSAPVTSVTMRNNIAFGNTTDWAYTRPPSNLVVDPKLVDPAKNDFRQKAGSPCREGGYAMALPAHGKRLLRQRSRRRHQRRPQSDRRHWRARARRHDPRRDELGPKA